MKITVLLEDSMELYLKPMKEIRKITTCDMLALETPLGSWMILHAQKSPWTLDVGHVDNLNGDKTSILTDVLLDKSRLD